MNAMPIKYKNQGANTSLKFQMFYNDIIHFYDDIIHFLPDSDISSQYGESNSYSARRICWNNAASLSS